MVVIGSGNTGMKLAVLFNENPILFSTAHQDTVNFQSFEVYTFSRNGARKNFRVGSSIWSENYEKLEGILDKIVKERVVIFSALGGGSGSSSLAYLSKALLKNDNDILIIGVLPYKKEINPPLANSVQAINSLMPLISRVSVMIFDNDVLRKKFNNNWHNINFYMIKRVDYLVNLLEKHASNEYSPLTVDQSELDSVVFGGGFIDFSDTFLEEESPKFEYGKLDKATKNCLIVMYVDSSIADRQVVRDYHNLFTRVLDKISTRISNSRLVSGILRAKLLYTNSQKGIEDRAYMIIASGLNIDKYVSKVEKIRDNAIKKAEAYKEKYVGSKFIERDENKLLDI